MSFSAAPGGTTVGQAKYVVSLETQQMLAGLERIEQVTRQSAQQVVSALGNVEKQEKQISEQTSQLASIVQRDVGQIGAMFAGVAGPVGQAATSVTQFGTQLGGLSGALGPAGLAVAGVTGAIAGMVKVGQDASDATVNFGKEVIQLQRVMGGSIETASDYVAVFKRFGVDSQETTLAMTALSRAMIGLDENGDKTSASALSAQSALQKLHVEVENTNGTMKSADEVFQAVIQALHDQGHGFETTEEARAIFQRGFSSMLPIIDQGSEGFKKLAEEARQFGLHVTAENVEDIKHYIAAQRDMQEASEGLQLKLGTSGLTRSLAEFNEDLVKTIDGLERVGGAFANAAHAAGDFMGELGRAAQATGPSGEPDITKLQALDVEAAAKRQAAAQAAAAKSVADAELDANQARAGSSQKLADAKKKQLEGQKKDDQDLADQMLRNLHDEEEAAQRTYDSDIKALGRFKEEATRANEGVHQAALDGLKREEDAAKEASDAQIRSAEIAKDRRIQANQESHESTIRQIEGERKAAEDASKDRVKNLEEQRDAEFRNIDTIKEAQLNALQAQSEARQEARKQEDRDREDARREEDRSGVAGHQAEIEGLKREHDVAAEGFKARRDEIERTKQAALDAIQVETDRETRQHEQALQHIQQEGQADQSRHDQVARAIEDEGRAAQRRHDAALESFRDEQQAAQDAHDQRIRQLHDEQQAEERASQARQAALRAEGDELSRQHQQRLSEIDAEAKAQNEALRQQLNALQQNQQAQQFAQQQAALQAKVAEAQTGVQIATEIAALTGDPNTIVAARKALADAQAALDKANADRAVQTQRDAIQQQIADLKDQVDAKKQAEDDQYRAEKDRLDKEIADEQKRLQTIKDSIAQQVQAANDQLDAIRRNIQQRVDAENVAFQHRQDQIAAEKRANDDRLAAELANLAKERDAENEREKQFQANEADKRKQVETTAATALAKLQERSDAEQKAYTLSTAQANARYQAEQQAIADTRRLEDRHIQDNRVQEDRDTATHRKAIEDTVKHDHQQIDDLYNAPKTGLIDIEKNALAETISDLDQRKAKADETYQAEQKQIKATYDDEETGLIPRLKRAWDEQKKNYDLRKGDIDATYQKEKDRIYDTFDKDTGDPTTWGLIPKVKDAYDKTKQSLVDQVAAWTQWKTDVTKEIGEAIGKLDDLIGKVKELNQLGGKVVRAPSDIQLPEDEQARRDAAAAAQAAGGRGLYGGEPLSVAQFGPGSATLRTQFGNASVDAMCGPIAAEALARLAGNPQDFDDILTFARSHGWWNASQGITGGGFGPIAEHYGVHTSIYADPKYAIDAIARGEPVVFNTANHYMLAQGYDPATGLFDLGYTGQTVYNQRYMTFSQLSARGGGFRNIYVADGLNMFAAGSAQVPVTHTETISVPSLGIEFAISAPAGPAAPTGAPTAAATGTYPDMARADARSAGIDPEIFVRQIQEESGFNPSARSGAGAIGIAQFMPGTAAGLGINPSDPVASLDAAARLMKNYVDQFGDIRLALAAYNAGPGNVVRYGGVPPFAETQKYVHDILGFANGGLIPEPTALVSLRDYRPYAVAGEVGPERVAPIGETAGNGRVMEQHTYYVSGIRMDEVARELQATARRERLLRGRL